MTHSIPRFKKTLALKLLLAVALIALSCGVSHTTAPPSLDPSPTALATIEIPDEGQPLLEAWKLIQRDFVENDSLDNRALSDGAILEILDVAQSTDLSLVEARDMVIRLRNVGGFFDGPGGPELRDAYEVWAYAYQSFVEEGRISVSELNEAAINGIVDALDDPYTIFLNEETLKLDQEDLQGSFEGIGAFVETNEDGFLIVIAPIPGTPADRAGILAGDLLMAVDGVPTNEMTLHEAIARIKGPRGTPVTLLVQHEDEEHPMDITVVRDVVQVTSVSLNQETDEISTIRITQFTQRTPSELEDALTQIRELDTKALIIDLRTNPGGLLVETVAVADQFIDEGLILYEEDNSGHRIDVNARPGGLASYTPLAILVNEFSASGAEVLAGALQDHNRGPIIGEQTFGKGSVTHLKGLSDGSGVYVTFARWFTPNGRLIEGTGITPDIQVNLTQRILAEEGDVQMDAAIAYLEDLLSEGT